MLNVAGISLPAEAEQADRLQKLVLARIAGVRPGAGKGVDKGVIAADLAAFAGPQMPAARWRAAVEAAIEALAAAKLIAATPAGFTVTKAGAAAVAKFLGAPVSSAVTWDQACNVWLVAKALGVRKGPARRMAALAAAEGLRTAIVMHAYGLNLKGKATPARLRQALAATALKRAFSGQGASDLADKLGLSARASRLLAAQLLDKPRDPGTDRRLIAALAAQACGASSAELPALRSAVLRRFLSVDKRSPEPAPVTRTKREPKAPQSASAPPMPASAQHRVRTNSSPPAEAARCIPVAAASALAGPIAAPSPLDLSGFASEVRRCAAGEAQGWSGDRKAYISRVWRSLQALRPEWGLSEIEFKGMLAEAHRAGQLALANADLKDASNIKDVQDSALIYKNAVFHFIRVDA